MGLLKHGHAAGGHYWEKRRKFSREYTTWIGMKQRCLNPRTKKYPRYGGRGIQLCERWHDFRKFYEDMGDCPEGLTLGRKDNNGPYNKDNCQWETDEQQANNKSSNHVVEYEGLSMTVAQWSVCLSMNYGALQSRISRGWPLNLALDPNVKSRPKELRAVPKKAVYGDKNCIACGDIFTPLGSMARYCSEKCREEWNKNESLQRA